MSDDWRVLPLSSTSDVSVEHASMVNRDEADTHTTSKPLKPEKCLHQNNNKKPLWHPTRTHLKDFPLKKKKSLYGTAP